MQVFVIVHVCQRRNMNTVNRLMVVSFSLSHTHTHPFSRPLVYSLFAVSRSLALSYACALSLCLSLSLFLSPFLSCTLSFPPISLSVSHVLSFVSLFFLAFALSSLTSPPTLILGQMDDMMKRIRELEQ